MVTVPETFPGTIPGILFGGRTIKAVNIKDVAKKAKVAVSTVSRVLNDHKDVSKDTKEHVLKIIDELNYIPNNSARNLKRTNTNSIGIFVLGEYNPFFGEIVETLENEISEKGYSVMVHFHHVESNAMETAVQFTMEKKLLGLICLGGYVAKENEGYLESLEAPTVFTSTIIDDEVNQSLFSSVSIDENSAVKEVMDHLIGLGHKRIGIITAEKQVMCASLQRYDAYKSILKESGLDDSEDYVECGDYSIESGYNSMKKLLAKKCGITALFAVNDLMAIGAAKAVLESGLRVPEDISIVGFDGLDYSKYFHPSITTIKQPNSLFGKMSCKVLLEQIEKSGRKEHIVLDTEFIVRESSCKNMDI